MVVVVVVVVVVAAAVNVDGVVVFVFVLGGCVAAVIVFIPTASLRIFLFSIKTLTS